MVRKDCLVADVADKLATELQRLAQFPISRPIVNEMSVFGPLRCFSARAQAHHTFR